MSLGRLSRALALASVMALGCGKSNAPDGAASNGADPTPPAAAPAAGSNAGATAGATTSSGEGYRAEALGALHFQVAGGTKAARAAFDRGLLALHSFWYDEAIHQFEAAIATDPMFSMAYWGLAMSHVKLLWGDDDVDAGREALRRMPSPTTLPPHDQAWVVAALTLFRASGDARDVRKTRQDFLGVMEQVHAKFPDDEAKTFLALALLATVRPDDPKQVQIRKRAAGLASEVFRRNPKHPGAAHYIIHAYDTPELATLALPAARQYATIAPAAFHALHMPAHIFVRLGMWNDAVASCQAAWDASVAWVRRAKLTPDHQDFHSLAWLVELNFERGHRADADRALAVYATAVRDGLPRDKRAAFANQVGSYLARTGDWARVDELLAPLDASAADAGGANAASAGSGSCGHPGLPGAAAGGPPNALFERRAVLGTRALAAAMRRDPKRLDALLAERDAVDRELHPFLVATQPKDFVDSADKIGVLVRKSLLARAKGDDRALIAALRPLAIDQDQEFTGEGTAGGTLDHEQIAEALVRLGQHRQALNEYRVVLTSHAGRARSLLGAARAALVTGDTDVAREYYRQLLAIWASADDGTDGIAEAQKFIAAHP